MWIQPASRTLMTSEWSFQIESGLESDRLASAMTMGSLMAAAMVKISDMRASPWELVEVKVLAPTAAEPQHTLMAECSLSTQMKRPSREPSAQNLASSSTIWVCGVIG